MLRNNGTRRGHVVNISTSLVDHASTAVPSALASLTKDGLNAVTRSLAIEYAARGVRVNTVSPGIIRTPMHAEETAPPGPVAGPGPDAAVPPPGPVAGWTGPPGPDAGWTGPLPGLHRPRFATDAVEVRFIAGAFGGGPATAWFRLIRPLVTAEEPTPLQRLAAAADFGAGLSSTLPRERYLFINTDLTLYVEREPVGEWICLDSQTRIASGGVGGTESVLYDLRGRVGRATQALLIAPR